MKIGRTWAYSLNVVAQLGTLISIVNSIMVAGLFYQNILSLVMPLWVFAALSIVGVSVAVVFIIRVGIPAYYRFMCQMMQEGQNDNTDKG